MWELFHGALSGFQAEQQSDAEWDSLRMESSFSGKTKTTRGTPVLFVFWLMSKCQTFLIKLLQSTTA